MKQVETRDIEIQTEERSNVRMTEVEKMEIERIWGVTLLEHLKKEGETRTAIVLIENYLVYKIDIRDENSDTPLHLAARKGDDTIVPLLIERGARINATNLKGDTPLFCVLDAWQLQMRKSEMEPDNKYIAVIKQLIEAGADYRNKLATMMTCAHLSNAYLLECILKLKEKGVNINRYTHFAFFLDRYDLLMSLLDQGADVNAKDEKGSTLLHHAVVADGTESIVKLLLGRGANIHAQTASGETALHLAVVLRGRKKVRMLLENGADVNAREGEGKTVLRVALETCVLNINWESSEPLDLVKYLLENGADPHIDVLEVWKRNNRTRESLMDKYYRRHRGLKEIVSILTFLLNKSVDPYKIFPDYLFSGYYLKLQFPVNRRVEETLYELLKLFIEKGWNVDTTYGGYSVLHAICAVLQECTLNEKKRKRLVAMADLLIRNGANLALKTEQGKTAGEILPVAWWEKFPGQNELSRRLQI